MSSTLAGFAPDRVPSGRQTRALASNRSTLAATPSRPVAAPIDRPVAASVSRPAVAPVPLPALRVPLNDVEPWHEALLIQPTNQPRGGVSVRIERLLDTARRPDDPQVRYRGTLDRDALLRLREAIDAVLGRSTPS